MSDIGLHASIYEQLRIYANRLDHGLAKLTSDNSASATQARQELAALMHELASETGEHPGPQLIAVILRRYAPNAYTPTVLERVANALSSSHESSTDIDVVEAIARILDKECMNAGSRMRGRA